jgi:hypothetical protein
VTREDRELFAELARLNCGMAEFCMGVMDGSVSAAEQVDYAERLIAVGERLRARAELVAGAIAVVETVVDGEVLESRPFVLPGCTVEPYRES